MARAYQGQGREEDQARKGAAMSVTKAPVYVEADDDFIFIGLVPWSELKYHDQEIVYWDRREWSDDPAVVTSIVDAVKIALTDGAETLAFKIGKEVVQLPGGAFLVREKMEAGR
jgi:hypothetical protein